MGPRNHQKPLDTVFQKQTAPEKRKTYPPAIKQGSLGTMAFNGKIELNGEVPTTMFEYRGYIQRYPW